MVRNKIINLPDPTRSTEQVTKRYVEANFNRGLTADGFTMRDHISMGGHEIVDLATNPSTDQGINLNNLPTQTNNDDAATKKYVDDKKCVFKDGSTTTANIDLRSNGFYDDVSCMCLEFLSILLPTVYLH